MSKHTQEPWLLSSDDFVAAESDQLNNGEYILSCFGPDQAANARRIVACVNACVGVSNGELAMTTMSVVLARMNEAERQRDEMLAALAEIDACFEAALIEGWNEAMTEGDMSSIKDIYYRRIDSARGAAMAALTGGAV